MRKPKTKMACCISIKPMASYSPRRLAAEVPIAEFVQLCSLVDEKFGEKVEVATSRINPETKFSIHVRRVRFNVLEIRRFVSGQVTFKIELQKDWVEEVSFDTKQVAA